MPTKSKANKPPMRFGDKIDFSRWAIVSYNDDTGLGRQATDTRKVLGLGFFFVLPSIKLTTKPLQGDREQMIPLDASEEYLTGIMGDVQGILILERLTHHLPLVQIAKKIGVMVACVPNWEHFAGWLSLQNQCDLFLCPSGMTYNVLRAFGFRNAVRVPCPLDLDLLPPRSVSGPARWFIHNGGVINKDDRKSTRDVITAFKQVNRSDIRLTVRLQKETELPALDSRIEVKFENLEEPSALYSEGDVAIQPSKLEGIGFTVLEAAVSGLPVITTDYPPMNEWIQDKRLLCKVGWKFHKVTTTKGIHHSHLRKPDTADLARRIEWCAENDMGPFSDQNQALRTKVFSPEKVRERWREALQACADGHIAQVLLRPPFSLTTPLFLVSSLFFRAARSFRSWCKSRQSTNTMLLRKGLH